jgi:hypothetical protein
MVRTEARMQRDAGISVSRSASAFAAAAVSPRVRSVNAASDRFSTSRNLEVPAVSVENAREIHHAHAAARGPFAVHALCALQVVPCDPRRGARKVASLGGLASVDSPRWARNGWARLAVRLSESDRLRIRGRSQARPYPAAQSQPAQRTWAIFRETTGGRLHRRRCGGRSGLAAGACGCQRAMNTTTPRAVRHPHPALQRCRTKREVEP